MQDTVTIFMFSIEVMFISWILQTAIFDSEIFYERIPESSTIPTVMENQLNVVRSRL